MQVPVTFIVMPIVSTAVGLNSSCCNAIFGAPNI